jgi:hypothetical protein
MPGIPRATYMPFPFRIVQGNGDILFVYEFASANRMVHMSNHQEPPVDSWMGWSNGRWEGDTLVIEVTGNNDQTWFDRAGNHHSALMKVTERYTLMGENHLQYEATIEDPETFSRPWKVSMPLYPRLDQNVQLHSWIHLDVTTPSGEVQKWMIEGGAPNALLRRGWNRNSLPAGIKIMVQGFQAKDGSFRTNGRDLTFADGSKLFVGSSGTGAPEERRE